MADLATGGDDHGVRGLKHSLLASMTRRLGDFEKNELYAVATLLHPRYKRTVFREKAAAEGARLALIRLVEEQLARTSPARASTSSSSSSTSTSTSSSTSTSFQQRMLRLRLY
jgi:hypothetical protein